VKAALLQTRNPKTHAVYFRREINFS
jgi:hypothetical protein